MKSVKPGRGPSMMSGVVGIFMIGFGILWTIFASQGGGIFALFGVIWTGAAIAITVYNFKNATGKNRYSAYDITEDWEEPDPLNERFGTSRPTGTQRPVADSRFCPYCGTAVAEDFEFCNSCGKKIP